MRLPYRKSAIVLLCLFAAAALPAGAQTAATENIMEMQDLSRPPLGGVAPKPIGPRDITMANYPRESFIAGEEGTVHLRVLVQADGAVGDALIEQSSGSPGLDRAAIQLVRSWKYVPANLNGAAIASRFPVMIDWRLVVLPYVLPTDKAREIDLASYAPVSAAYRFLLTDDAKIANVVVEKSSGNATLDDAVMKIVKLSRFTPARLSASSPAGVWMRLPLTFGTNVYFSEMELQNSETASEIPLNGKAPTGIVAPIPLDKHVLRAEDYGKESIRKHETGRIDLKFLVRADGAVGSVKVTKGSNYPYLDYAAAAFVKKWRYTPALRDGKPVSVWLNARTTFESR